MNPESILREVFEEQAEGVAPPVGVYAGVRRRHRRQQLIVAGTAAAVVLAAGVPAVALGRHGPAAPTAGPAITAPPGFDLTKCPVTPSAGPDLPAQHDVRGALGGDTALVAATARAAWKYFTFDPFGRDTSPVDPHSLRVLMVDRSADGIVVAAATATDAAGTVQHRLIIGGPDAAHLGSVGGGFSGTPLPADLPYVSNVDSVCGNPRKPSLGVVVAPPGTTGTLGWTAGVSRDGKVDARSMAAPLRTDGTGVFALPAGFTTFHLVRRGRTTENTWLSGANTTILNASAAEIDRALASAPGDGNAKLASDLLVDPPGMVPLPQTAVRVLWKGKAPDGATIAVAATTLPSGAHYLWGGTSRVSGVINGFYGGYTAADALTGTAFLWPATRTSPRFVVVPGTAVVEAGGTSRTVTGGAVIPDGAVHVRTAAGTEIPIVDVTTLPKPAF